MKIIRMRSLQVGLAIAASVSIAIVAACGGDTSSNLGGGNSSSSNNTGGNSNSNSTGVGGSTSTGGGNTSGSTATSGSTGVSTSGGTSTTGTGTVCPTPGPACCLADTDCTGMNATVCDLANNRCVQCTPAKATACTGNTPVCSPSTNRCQASCAVDGGTCRGGVGGGGATVCDTTTGACVGCLTTATGTMPGVCPPAGGNMNDTICNPTSQTCVQCTATDKTNCTGNRPFCNTGTGACVACAVNSDCTGKTTLADGGGTATPICRNNACVAGCMTSAECPLANQPAADKVCNTTNNTCTQCLTNSDCAGRTSVADGGGAPLSICRTAGGAGGGGAGTCVECTPVAADAGTPPGCTAGQTCMVVGGNARCM